MRFLRSGSRGTHLRIVDHMNSLEDDVPGVLAEEGEYVCDAGLVRQAAQADAVPLHAARDDLLRDGAELDGLRGHLRDQRRQGGLCLLRTAGVHATVQHLKQSYS